MYICIYTHMHIYILHFAVVWCSCGDQGPEKRGRRPSSRSCCELCWLNIYMYRERERQRERDTYIYIYIHIERERENENVV